ncbi:MAG: zinc metallopeptidase [Lautropia sp.]|nr:zinc metallopeptidase [Lautropia sp.]
MRWQGGRQSQNVEDRRGQRSAGGIPGLGGGLGRGGGIGVGTIVVAMLVAWLFGINPLTFLGMLEGGGPAIEQGQMPRGDASLPAPGSGVSPGGQPDAERDFVSVVLGSTEDVWNSIFQKSGNRYPAPTLVLFRGSTPTACGHGSAAAGPFYCPGDQKLYIDLSFYKTMRDRLGAPGDTAQAYVIAHEVGHHIQNLTGTMSKMAEVRQQTSERQYNDMSVRLELQADCFAGIWAHHSQQARSWFEQGDIEEALNAAAAVGDDNIQRRTQGTVVPESFTHGTAAQRARWFRTGLQSGAVSQCDTFAAKNP